MALDKRLGRMQEMELGSNASSMKTELDTYIAGDVGVAANVADVEQGADAAALRTSINAILKALQDAGLMETAAQSGT